MKNFVKWLGIISMALVIGFSFTACDDGSGGDGGDSAVNGTWVSDSDQLILNNGNAEWKESGTSVMKAAYTTSGSSITFNITQMWGPTLGDDFDSRWYTKAELIEAGASASFFSFTGSYTAATLTFTWMGDNYSYTKSGGTPPGGGDSAVNGTWVSDSDQLILNNGNAEWKESGTSVMKAAYTTSGSSITFNISQMWGPTLGDDFDSRWYTKAELIAAGASASFFSFTGSYTAATLTFTWMGDNYSYTKQGGSNPGTNPGGGSSGNWTAVTNSTFGDSNIMSIAYGGGTFVAGGSGGKMAYSSDGVNWTAVANSTFGTSYVYITAIAYGGGKFVAGDDSGNMAYSSNGITWTAIPSGTWGAGKSTFDRGINAIAWGNGTFVAGDYNGRMAYSPDGVNWTAVADKSFSDESDAIDAIAYGSGKFVAGGDYGRMAYSSDGINWTKIPAGTSAGTSKIDRDIKAIAYGNSKFVAGGYGGKIAYSSDGVNWTAVTNSTFNAVEHIFAIAYGNNKFVVGDWSGTTAYSSDGTTWTKVTNTIFSTDAIAYGNGKFVIGGSFGRIAYSTGL